MGLPVNLGTLLNPKRPLKMSLGAYENMMGVVDRPSYYPDLPRKPRRERIADNVRWWKEWGFVNECYNEYGLDVKDFRNQDDYIERWAVKQDRNSIHHGSFNPRNHKNLVLDKVQFYSYLEKLLPGYTPKVRVVLMGNRLFFPMLEKKTSVGALRALPDGKYAVKPSRGTMGKSFFSFTKTPDGKFVMGGEAVTARDITREARGKRFLIQDFVKQHDALNKIAPNTLNTVRIETVRWHTTTNLHYGLARFSAREGATVDNATQGGTFVGIDLETGKLKKYGEYFDFENGAHETHHPVTGVQYEGYQIPYWDQIVELVQKLHPLFYGLAAVGWDIAITTDGPITMEANSSPCSKMAQMANGGLKERWNSWKDL